MVQLEYTIGHRQPNAASPRLGCEIQIKNLLSYIFRNSIALVCDTENSGFPIFFQNHFQLTPFGHRLRAVQDDVEGGLFEQIGVYLCN